MLKRSLRTLLSARGNRPAGRALEVAPDDAFIVSYPKSGNTWVRFMVAALAAPDRQIDFVNVHEIVPDIYRASPRVLARLPRPRILKSHEYFDPRYPKVVYLVRDPRDVCISYFHFRLRRFGPGEGPLDRHVARFLAGELDPFGRWRENVGSWLGARRDDPGFLLVRYEDLVSEPARELRRIAAFLGLSEQADAIDLAVRRSSFDEMRRIERFQAEVTGHLEKERVRQPFVRSGRVGGWQDELPDQLARMIERACREPMELLGYPPAGWGRRDAVKAG